MNFYYPSVTEAYFAHNACGHKWHLEEQEDGRDLCTRLRKTRTCGGFHRDLHVHGLAFSIGGYFPIPHGVICGALVAPSVRANLKALRARDPESPALAKMARVGELLSGKLGLGGDEYCDVLLETLDRWTEALSLPPLGQYGIEESDLDKILDKAANRNNPIQLTREEIRAMLLEWLAISRARRLRLAHKTVQLTLLPLGEGRGKVKSGANKTVFDS